MKNYLIVLFAFISFAGHSQVSFGSKHFNKPADLEKGDLEKFKSTTTIFVLSDIISKEEYEKILKETWTVTPYKIMTRQEFNLLDMYSKNYSFGEIITYKKSKQTKMGNSVSWIYTYLDIGMYDVEEIDKKLPKVKAKKEKKRKSKIKDIFIENKDAIARFYFYPTGEFVDTALSGDEDVIVEDMYTKNVFFNYTTGMLKNYFQKTNSLIANGNTYAMSGKDFDADKIASLSTSKLYIPEYVKQKTDAFTADIDDQD